MMTSHKKVPTEDEFKRTIMYLEAALDMEKKKYAKVPVIPSNPPRHTDSRAWGYVVIGYFLLEQCFGQNSGRPVSDRAIVTKVLVIGAGFFQAMPLG